MQTVRMIRLTETRSVACILRKRRGQKKLTLRVSTDGVVTLTVPRWIPYGMAETYVTGKREWLVQALERFEQQTGSVVNGPEREARVALPQRMHYEQFRESARILVSDRLDELNRHYGFTWGRVTIRMTSSRWGSCSSKGNLNFDYRIVFLPPHLRDYLVVHELCHLREMNHSERFWSLVAQAVPEWASCRKELRGMRRAVGLPASGASGNA